MEMRINIQRCSSPFHELFQEYLTIHRNLTNLKLPLRSSDGSNVLIAAQSHRVEIATLVLWSTISFTYSVDKVTVTLFLTTCTPAKSLKSKIREETAYSLHNGSLLSPKPRKELRVPILSLELALAIHALYTRTVTWLLSEVRESMSTRNWRWWN